MLRFSVLIKTLSCWWVHQPWSKGKLWRALRGFAHRKTWSLVSHRCVPYTRIAWSIYYGLGTPEQICQISCGSQAAPGTVASKSDIISCKIIFLLPRDWIPLPKDRQPTFVSDIRSLLNSSQWSLTSGWLCRYFPRDALLNSRRPISEEIRYRI